MRFRERKLEISADISEMFHQVKIIERDQHCKRFLWLNPNTGNLDTYILQGMTFGATCSQGCVQFIKKKNATDFIEQFSRTVLSITKKPLR